VPTETTRDELELRDYLAALRRRWQWAIIPLVVFGVLAIAFTLIVPLRYESTARVLVGTSAAQDAVTEPISVNLLNETNLARSDAVTTLVRQRLGLTATDQLPEGRIDSEPETDVLAFTFAGATPEEAALITNIWANAYVEVKQADAVNSINDAVAKLDERLQSLRDERAALRANLVSLENRLATASEAEAASLSLQVDREASAISGDLNLLDTQIASNVERITQLQLAGELAVVGTARVVHQAALPLEATNAPLSRNLIIGLLIGALAGVSVALLVDNLDHSITDAEDIQRMGLTLLGVIPEAPRKQLRSGLATVAQTQPGTTLADSYQKVRTALQFTTLGTDTKTILVTSPMQGDGKTTTATNLALALANVESRVVLADIDFRRPQIHTIFDTELIPGISDALVGRTTLRQVAVNHPELSTTLVAMPAGTQPPNPATFLVSSRFSGLLSDLRNQADLTILDAPPVLPVADAVSIASQIDGIVLVVRAGHTTHDELTSAVESITRSGGQLLGVVVNGARAKATTYGVIGGQPAMVRPPEEATTPGETPTTAGTNGEGGSAPATTIPGSVPGATIDLTKSTISGTVPLAPTATAAAPSSTRPGATVGPTQSTPLVKVSAIDERSANGHHAEATAQSATTEASTVAPPTVPGSGLTSHETTDETATDESASATPTAPEGETASPEPTDLSELPPPPDNARPGSESSKPPEPPSRSSTDGD
jgi:capsular exopolysaccharide synthesis family protein